MNSITPNYSSTQNFTQENPSFGMAVRFNKSGRQLFNKVFANNPENGLRYIARQAENKTSDIYVKGSKVSVDVDGKKWQIVSNIHTKKPNSRSIDEIMLTRQSNMLNRQSTMVLIRENGDAFEKRYGDSAKLFAIAEDIANSQAYQKNNAPKTLVQKLKNLL